MCNKDTCILFIDCCVLGSNKFTMDTHSVDHTTPPSDSVRDEDFEVHSVVDDDDGASVDKADKLSISSHYHINSRRRSMAGSQRGAANLPGKSVDILSSTYVII